MRTKIIFTIFTLSFIAGCQKCSKEQSTTESEGQSDTTELKGDVAVHERADVKKATSLNELTKIDDKEGSGAEAESGNLVSVHYTGWLTDGTKFDSSRDRNAPFDFPLGQRRVISGWDEGVKGMKIGGKRILVIPPSMGYGERGAGHVIPPNSTLIFEVELIAIK